MATPENLVITLTAQADRFAEAAMLGVRSPQLDLFEEPAIEPLFSRLGGMHEARFLPDLAGAVRSLEAGDAPDALRRLERLLEEMELGWRSMW
jgi:hypothetical protein